MEFYWRASFAAVILLPFCKPALATTICQMLLEQEIRTNI